MGFDAVAWTTCVGNKMKNKKSVVKLMPLPSVMCSLFSVG